MCSQIGIDSTVSAKLDWWYDWRAYVSENSPKPVPILISFNERVASSMTFRYSTPLDERMSKP